MRLLLIRHGQTEANVNRQLDTAHPGMPLNETGLGQAEALVAALEHEPIEALYASTLTRAQQTAAPLARARALEAVILEGIHEISAGVEEMNTDWRAYLEVLMAWAPDNLDVGLEDGETAREFLARFDAAIAQVEANGHERVALVSHGAALRVWALSKDPSIGQENAAPLENTTWIVLNGSTADGWKIERWGEFLVDGDLVAAEA